MRPTLSPAFVAAMVALNAMMQAGATPAAVAAFVLQLGPASVAVSHVIEDQAFDGTFAAAVFAILCGDDEPEPTGTDPAPAGVALTSAAMEARSPRLPIWTREANASEQGLFGHVEVRTLAGELVRRVGPFPAGSDAFQRAWSGELQATDIHNRSRIGGDQSRQLVHRV